MMSKASANIPAPELHSRRVCAGCGAEELENCVTAPDRFFSRSVPYRVVRCRRCSLAWLDDPPRPEDMGDHYGADYDAFIRKATEGDSGKHWRNAVAGILKYKTGGALLDLGCGSGSFLGAIKSPAWALHGIEMSADAAAAARKRTGADVFAGDILDAQFEPGTFDAVTCFHVFEHLYSPVDVMARVHTWLKPGGIFCVHVPNIDAAEARVFRSYWYPLELPRHLFHFSPQSLGTLGKALGYEAVSLGTRHVSFIEHSGRYIVDDFLGRAGVSRAPLSAAPPPSLLWRILRKGLRLTVLPLASAAISMTGEGQIVEAVFRNGS